MGKTEIKNPDDARFRKNRRRFFYSFNQILCGKFTLSIRPADIYHHAKLSKGTFYRHFHSTNQVFQDQISETYYTFKLDFSHFYRLNHSDPSLQNLFVFLAIFISRNKNTFATVFASHNTHLVHQILWDFQPYLTKNWRAFSPADSHNLYSLLVLHLETVLYEWSRHNFRSNLLQNVVSCLTKNTEIFNKNLSVFYALSTNLKRVPSKPDFVHPDGRRDHLSYP